MRRMFIYVSGKPGPMPFNASAEMVEACRSALRDPDGVISVTDDEGVFHIPVRHIATIIDAGDVA